MNNVSDNSDLQEKIRDLEQRVKRLSEDKANLFLIHHLLEILLPAGDLDTMLNGVMQGLGQCVGGTNVEIYYFEEQELHYVNLIGQHIVLKEVSDPMIREVFEQKKLIEKTSEFNDTLLLNSQFANAWDWVIPLNINLELIGAVKISNMLGSAQMRDYLKPFFQHLSLILSNQLKTRAAQAANKAKSEFLAVISHEIKTPLNAILGIAQLLKTPELSFDKQQQYVAILLNSGKILLDLLNEILDLSQVEAGKLQLHSTVFSPYELIHNLQLLFKESANKRELKITARCSISKQNYFSGDKNRIQQILSNLINNAIKYTDHGFIEITANEISRSENIAIIEYSVRDTGIGIPEDKKKLLFKPFTQIDGSHTRRYGGSGLGLSIVRELCQLMGGETGFESREGKGSRFWVRIPMTLSATNLREETGLAEDTSDSLDGERQAEVLQEKMNFTDAEKRHIQQLESRLDRLLADNMFAALHCFKELQCALKGSIVSKEMDGLKNRIENMEFDLARRHLQKLHITDLLKN